MFLCKRKHLKHGASFFFVAIDQCRYIYIYIDIFIQWNAVDTVTNGPKKLGRFNEVTVLTRVFFFGEENLSRFLPGGQKSGRITEVAVRRGFTVLGCEA